MRACASLRNVVVHEYFAVDVDALRETAAHDLPPLEPMLRELLDESD